MGGNDTHDKYGRPYELDDGADALYDRLEEAREEISILHSRIQEFQKYLDKEIDECGLSGVDIEFSVLNYVKDEFIKILGS